MPTTTYALILLRQPAIRRQPRPPLRRDPWTPLRQLLTPRIGSAVHSA